ncbi:coatomer subunit epsilon [Clonorchis sinensis]|uniref:Coatomer subunit epsilon n=1 Tax=Clonorchis sinensis TaxID=79923 RepID=G7Y361_CLOSI|nr:coatomer subunit epsilon [Clonorchis sinensis]
MVAGADLLDAHHAYLLGNFQHALRILQKIKDKELQLKVDVLTYRVYLAQKKYGIVLDEIREDSEHIELRFIRLIATFLTSTNARERVLREAEKLLTGTLGEDAEPILVLAATLYLNADLPELALRTLHPGEGVYCSALRVQCFMAMNRYDLAGKEVRRMQTADEDALPCQLATALFNLSKGGEQLQEALNIYEELKERYGATSVILNGQAAALIGMNKWEEAESILQEALDADAASAYGSFVSYYWNIPGNSEAKLRTLCCQNTLMSAFCGAATERHRFDTDVRRLTQLHTTNQLFDRLILYTRKPTQQDTYFVASSENIRGVGCLLFRLLIVSLVPNFNVNLCKPSTTQPGIDSNNRCTTWMNIPDGTIVHLRV